MPNLKFKPLGDRILVQHARVKELTKGGVLIPDGAKEKSQEASVIALGTGVTAKDGTVVPFEVRIGDTVLIAKFAGSEIEFGNKKYTLVREDDILGVIA